MTRSRTTLSALFLSLAALLLPALASAQSVVSQTSIGGGPRVVAVNPVNNKVYIARHGAGSVRVIDVATGATHDVDDVSSGLFGPPTTLAVDPNTGSVVVGGESMLAVIDGNTDAIKLVSGFLARANLGAGQITGSNAAATIAAVVVNPPGQSSFYADPANNLVYPGDLNGSYSPGVPAVPCPGAMAVNPVTGALYIAETCNQALATTSNNFFSVFTFSTPIDPDVTHVNPTAVAVNPATGFVYVTLEGTNGVQVIDNNTNPVLATGFSNPTAVAVNPVTNKIYVANTNSVVEIDGATNATTPIAVGGPSANLVAISVDNVHNRIYVANKGESSIAIIDGASRVVTNFSLDLGSGGAPNSVAVNPRTQRVYVVDETNGLFTVLDDRQFTSNTSVSVANATEAVTDPIRERAFFANGTHVAIVNGGIDASDDGLVANVDMGGTVAHVAVDPISGTLFAAKADNTMMMIGTDNAIVTNPDTTPRVITLGISIRTPTAIAVNPASQKVYVTTTEGQMQVIDAKSMTLVDTKTTGNVPVDIAVDAANNHVYVADNEAPGFDQNMFPNGILFTLNGTNSATTRVVVNPATGRAYFVHATVIDEFDGLATFGNLIHTYGPAATPPVNFTAPPTDIAVNSITNHVYVTDGTDVLHVLDPVSQADNPIGLPPGDAGNHVSVDELRNLVYVSTATRVFTLDGENGNIVAVANEPSAGKAAVDPGTGEAWLPLPGAGHVLALHGATVGSGIQQFGDGTAITVPGASGFVTSLASPVFQANQPTSLYTPHSTGSLLAHGGADDFYGPSVAGSFDSGTNKYSVGVPTPLAKGLHYFTMFATDSMSGTVTNSQTGTLGANGGLSFLMGAPTVQPFVVIDPPTLPAPAFDNGTEGIAYTSSQQIATSGGTGHNTFAVTSGALPDGLSIDSSTGAISGTPTLQNTYPFTVTVTDDSGGSTSTPMSITIQAGTPGISVNPSLSFGSVTVGSTASLTITVSNTGWGAIIMDLISVTGTNAADFTIPPAQNTCDQLTHLQSCTIEVDFTPSAAGPRSAAVQIGNDFAPGTQVPVSGIGVATSHTITAAADGTGTGTTTSSPAGINCPGDCSEAYANGTVVTLTATPAAGSAFSQWTNCPSANANLCTVTVGSDITVTATFTALTVYNIVLEGYQEVAPYVQTSGSGSGTATFDSFTGQLKFNISYSGLTNNETDSHIYDAPRGANGPAIIPMSSTTTKTDAIHLSPQQQLDLAAGKLYVNIATAANPNGEIRGQIDNAGATTVHAANATSNGTGNGIVVGTSEAGGIIVCGSLCTANVPHGKSVTFTNIPTSGSIFAGWSGACSGTGACQVTMDAAKTVNATFNLAAGPTTTVAASATTVMVGQNVTFTASASGASGTPTGSVIFQDGNQPLDTVTLDGTGHATFSTTALAAGSHPITVKYSGDGTYAAATSPPVTVNVYAANDVPRLGNISTRGSVLTGFNVMIGGFVIGGSVPKTVVVRAIGPSLANFGVTGVLANPTMQLVRQSDGATIATNDDWQSAANAADVLASGFAPTNAHESAILMTLDPGAYTAVVSGVNNTTGVGLVEVYEVDHTEDPLINISTRGRVGTGGSVMIGGFVVQGTAPQTVVIRAIGPSLANFGVTGALQNPTMSLVRLSDNATIATNDDWQSAPNAAQISASGFAPSNPHESAILMTLAPGAYTAVVTGVGNTTGIGLVEVYTTAGP